jgi:hypothetical protein
MRFSTCDPDDLGGDLLVQLHVAFEVGHDRTPQRFRFDGLGVGIGQRDRGRLVELGAVGILLHARALQAFDQHLHRAVRQFEELQDARKRAGLVDRIGRGIVVGRILLRRQYHQRIIAHHLFEGADGFLAADEQRHDVVRKNDDIAERQHRIGMRFAVDDRWPRFRGGHGLLLLLCPLARSSRFCATATRCRIDPNIVGLVAWPGSFRIDDEANLNGISRRPTLKVAIGDGGVKSVKLPAKLRANAGSNCTKHGRGNTLHSRFFSGS